LVNGDSIGAFYGDSTNLTISHCFTACREKGKKGGRNVGKSAPCQHSKMEETMKRKNTKTKQQGCDVAKLIDTIEKAASAAKQIYRAAEPVIKRVLKRGTKTK
jgi:hypothetical protein